MRFLGMAGYYRRFCKNFSDVVAPLTDVLKKKVKFKWSESCKAAFRKIKAVLVPLRSVSPQISMNRLHSLRHFEVYVCPASYSLKVYTDHNPLSRMSSKNQRIMRWSLELQKYNLDIHNIKDVVIEKMSMLSSCDDSSPCVESNLPGTTAELTFAVYICTGLQIN
ncbi:uncharacterized protein LOC119568911 [Penaeus monodon]|uniref:uncharacterized protein LOC119568911 n=1 Tax=Penaeus monodon TaxID=6687 RepID=UPI0018A78960|nr:uncharacterized protein LOC119568911 [Penaeus monodon]